MALPDGFLDRLDNDAITVERSVFLDQNGLWAKERADVVEVFVEFSDAATYRIASADFYALNRTRADKVRHASSSPLP